MDETYYILKALYQKLLKETNKSLKQMCKEKNLTHYSHLNKANLVRTLLKLKLREIEDKALMIRQKWNEKMNFNKIMGLE